LTLVILFKAEQQKFAFAGRFAALQI